MENMEKDDKFMKLDIQLFAEDGDGVGTPTENGEKGADGSSKNEKLYSRDEVNRMISAEKRK